ncbi:MAG TPA: Gfo/Idh/MocA family oxidoreductase, partial [Gemmatimonadales bacterium]
YDPVYEEHGVDYPLGYVRWTEQRNLETFVQLAATGGISMAPLITHRFPIADAASAYNLITGEQKEPFLGVTLSYPAAPKADKAVTVRSAPVARAGTAKVGVAVIGAGNYARAVLLPRLAKMPHVRLVAVTSAGGVSALDAARQFGFERAATGHEDVIADPAVQCVIVETRHNLHAEISEQALKAGKATFIEKPLALTEEQLKRVASAWVAGGRPAATVGFNRRFAPMIGALRQFQSGRRGPWIITLRVNAGFIPDTSWVVDPDVGGGRLLGEGCHFIDLAQHLAGAQPVEVFCSGPSPDLAVRQGESITTIRFDDGSVASVAYATGGSKLYGKERVEVLGGGAVATIDDYRLLDLADAERRSVTKDRWSQNKGHEAYLDGYLKALAEGRPFGVDFRDLLVTSLATIRAVDSVRAGQPTPVDGAAFLRAAGVD